MPGEADPARQSFGIPDLDDRLGGGLRPGTLTVIAGATGVGKTLLGLHWAANGLAHENARGVLVDLTSRGDPQNHTDYARSRLNWPLNVAKPPQSSDVESIWSESREQPGELLHPFAGTARRATKPDLDIDAWDAWKRDLARVLHTSSRFLYTHFVRGVRRVVFDGIEPAERTADSIQLELLEYLYDRLIRQDDDWAAREVLRERFRALESQVLAHRYQSESIGSVALVTTPEVTLNDLLERQIGQGNLFATANTVILVGRVRESNRFGRALCIVKHRGSACSEEILPFEIGDRAITFGT
jgi:KaiC/GvpD/RAD55 family RecA-like ATPase